MVRRAFLYFLYLTLLLIGGFIAFLVQYQNVTQDVGNDVTVVQRARGLTEICRQIFVGDLKVREVTYEVAPGLQKDLEGLLSRFGEAAEADKATDSEDDLDVVSVVHTEASQAAQQEKPEHPVPNRRRLPEGTRSNPFAR